METLYAPHGAKMSEQGKKTGKLAPWIHGILETMTGAELLHRTTISHRNRLSVILLDSALETASRAFLKYKVGIKLGEPHKHRANLISAVRSNVKDVDPEVWETLDFYYEEIRCDLYHESAGKTITEESFLEYQETVVFLIDRMLAISSEQLVKAQVAAIESQTNVLPSQLDASAVLMGTLTNETDKVIMAIGELAPRGYEQVNEFFKKAGDSLRLTSERFTAIIARNPASKKYFYHDKELKVWQLSGLGKYRLRQIQMEENHERQI
jgi:hypothetical protein